MGSIKAPIRKSLALSRARLSGGGVCASHQGRATLVVSAVGVLGVNHLHTDYQLGTAQLYGYVSWWPRRFRCVIAS